MQEDQYVSMDGRADHHIWSAKAAVLETQKKMTPDRLRIEEATQHGRTKRTDLSKIELTN
ncbi:hypothetical protein BLOT_005659 [Blomia tropicalis]|nr:hypothetical protein BLOT_005659 [Blomia tropicalis]